CAPTPANASPPPAAPVAAPVQPPPAAIPAFQPVAAPPPAIFEMPPTAAEPAPAPPSRRGSSPDGMVRTPSGRFVRGRTTGDELITALFESMHDLHFLRDALDGGQFCLALATEVLPARAALIHFFDVEKREWVIACTRGKDTSRLLTLRTPESDELLRGAARSRRAVVTANATDAAAQRYQSLGGTRSMIIAPIMQAGRALGAIEIINPLDGMPFTDDEGNAMTYIAEQYAEYLGSRGIVLDRERIQAAAR
ncbi:MAG TPA: GAF domain-containing protein, partial [Labilithrix sp.]|nr:GAF domain-containing protein [Labilithrix sp.]